MLKRLKINWFKISKASRHRSLLSVKEKRFQVGKMQTLESNLLYEIELPLKVRKINLVLSGSVGKRVALANVRVVDLIPTGGIQNRINSHHCKPLWIKCLLNSVLSIKYTTIPSRLGRKQ